MFVVLNVPWLLPPPARPRTGPGLRTPTRVARSGRFLDSARGDNSSGRGDNSSGHRCCGVPGAAATALCGTPLPTPAPSGHWEGGEGSETASGPGMQPLAQLATPVLGAPRRYRAGNQVCAGCFLPGLPLLCGVCDRSASLRSSPVPSFQQFFHLSLTRAYLHRACR